MEKTKTRDRKSSKGKYWCFTINNPDKFVVPHLKGLVKNECVSSLVFQREKVETEHIQGYIELSRQQRLSWLRKNVSSTAHFELRRGTREDCFDYCQKDDSYIGDRFSYGFATGSAKSSRKFPKSSGKCSACNGRYVSMVYVFNHDPSCPILEAFLS